MLNATVFVTRLTHPLALIGDLLAVLDSIRNIAFTDAQVYCATGTRKITSGVAQMLQSATGAAGIHDMVRAATLGANLRMVIR